MRTSRLERRKTLNVLVTAELCVVVSECCVMVEIVMVVARLVVSLVFVDEVGGSVHFESEKKVEIKMLMVTEINAVSK